METVSTGNEHRVSGRQRAAWAALTIQRIAWAALTIQRIAWAALTIQRTAWAALTIQRTAWAALTIAIFAVCALPCIANAPSETAPATPVPPEPSAAALPLAAAIAALADDVAGLGDADAVYALEPSEQASLLDGYVAHMLAAQLQGRGLTVRRFADPLCSPGAQAPETLPRPFLQELRVTGAALFVHASATVKQGERLLTGAVYDAGTGRRTEIGAKAFLLPQELQLLVSGERARLTQKDNNWLEVLDAVFPDASGPAADSLGSPSAAEYLFEAGLWPAAGRALLQAAGNAPNRLFMRSVVALQLGGEGVQAASLVRSAVKKHPDNGPLWTLRGWLSLRQGHPEDAVIWLEQARLCDLAREGLYRYAAGLLAAEEKRDEAARQEFVRAAELLPGELFTQLRAARFYRDRAELSQAVEYYKRATNTAKPTPQTWAELAVALEADGKVDEAIAALRQAFRLETGDLAITRQLAALLKRKGQHEEALDVLRRAADANPRNAGLLAAYGDAAFTMWRVEAAQKAYEESAATSGEVAYAKMRLAALFAATGRCKEARDLLTDLLASRPNYVPARIQLGRLLGQLGRAGEAESLLTEATTSAEYEVGARLALAELYLATKQPHKAVTCAQIAASSRPDGQTYAALAEAFLAAGDIPKADSAVATALEQEPLLPRAHLSAALVLQAKGQTQPALEEASRSIEIDPYSVDALELAGSLYQSAGDFRKCAEFWKRALALDPWHAELHRRLGDVLGPQFGDWAAARDHLTEYVNLEKARTEAAR